jgi:hypothetical protein
MLISHGRCPDVKWPNLFTGIDISLNEELALVFEYNFGFNTRDFHGRTL